MFVGKEKSRELYLKKHPEEVSVFEMGYSYQRYFQNVPKKLKNEAQQKFYIERRSGRIKRQPCMVCGEKTVQGHHEDYSKPLQVMWLCHKHHCERHSELNLTKREIIRDIVIHKARGLHSERGYDKI